LLALTLTDGLGPVISALSDSNDRSLRTAVLDRLPELADAQQLLALLREVEHPDVRQVLLLALAEMRRERLPESDWEEFAALARSLYQQDANRGVHSAAEYVLRRIGNLVALPPGPPSSTQSTEWYQGPNGHTFIRVAAQADAAERPTQPFFLTAHEVSLAQYRAMVPDYQPHSDATEYLDAPALGLSIAQAAAYCNWLSQLEGLPPDQWCYPPTEGGRLQLDTDKALSRSGYRLPSPAEWQSAFRAGSSTHFSFGNDRRYALKYGWLMENANGRIRPSGLKRPNAWGFFDMLGNAMELCPLETAPSPTSGAPSVVYLGGTTSTSCTMIDRQLDVPSLSLFGLPMGGFRVARSVLPREEHVVNLQERNVPPCQKRTRLAAEENSRRLHLALSATK
jgi:eukaryotic-like serine/threonine-protein kinase